MFIILPDEITGLAEVEKNLKKINIDQLLRGTRLKVKVYLPKFKIESNISLDIPLFKVSNFFTSRRFFTQFPFLYWQYSTLTARKKAMFMNFSEIINNDIDVGLIRLDKYTLEIH